MRLFPLLALSVLSVAATAPAIAQGMMAKDNMKSDKMMKMSDADMKKMKACQAMPHDKMMKNTDCAKMMKMHPDMMKSDGMMTHDNKMKSSN